MNMRKPVEKGGYRAHRKKFFLTYPQCPIPMEEARVQLASIAEIDKYLIAQEKHEDGEFHLHCFISFKKDYDTCNARWADLKWDEKIYHFNDGGAVRNDAKVARYCRKDGNYISNYYLPDVFATAISAPTVAEGVNIIVQQRPREAVIYLESIERNLKRLKRMSIPPFVSPYTPDQFVIPFAMQDWLNVDFKMTERARCLILVGKTRLGKTAWARSLGRHMFFRGQFNLEKWDDDAKYIVIDDIPWDYIPNKKQLLTQMGECELTDKYKGKQTQFVKQPAIVCLNAEDMNTKEIYGDYWSENAIVVRLDDPLYKLN